MLGLQRAFELRGGGASARVGASCALGTARRADGALSSGGGGGVFLCNQLGGWPMAASESEAAGTTSGLVCSSCTVRTEEVWKTWW